MNKVSAGLVLATLLAGVLASAFSIHAVRASGTVYIRADGSIDPPTAPIQRNGNVYTLTGNINSDADGIIVERDNIVVDGSGFAVEGTGTLPSHGVYLDGRSNVTIQNTNIKNFDTGISLFFSSNYNSVNGNTITNNNDGIWLRNSSNNSISGNSMTDNNDYGIELWDFSSYNSINGNTIADTHVGFGIVVWTSSSNNRISANTITYSHFYGIYLYDSSDNSIHGNTVTNNNDGIYLYDSSNNTVCHNNFVNNTAQTYNDTPLDPNFWDNGCEGNYWSNYNGTDMNSDGVGDTILPCAGVDNYPLMNAYWCPCDINHDLKVDMRDVGVSAKAFGTSPDDAPSNPHADITGPEPLVADGKVDIRDISLIAQQYGEHCA